MKKLSQQIAFLQHMNKHEPDKGMYNVRAFEIYILAVRLQHLINREIKKL